MKDEIIQMIQNCDNDFIIRVLYLFIKRYLREHDEKYIYNKNNDVTK